MEEIKEVKKLFAMPVQDSVTYPDGKGHPIWLHGLKHPSEKVVCLHVFRETYEMMKANGSEEEDCKVAANFSYIVQELLFSCRKGEDPKSDKVFKNTKELISIAAEAWRLHEVYTEAFEATEEELGE